MLQKFFSENMYTTCILANGGIDTSRRCTDILCNKHVNTLTILTDISELDVVPTCALMVQAGIPIDHSCIQSS